MRSCGLFGEKWSGIGGDECALAGNRDGACIADAASEQEAAMPRELVHGRRRGAADGTRGRALSPGTSVHDGRDPDEL
jgi:hypothetical protein